MLGGATRAHGAASARKASAQLKYKGDKEGKNSKNLQTLFSVGSNLLKLHNIF